MGVAVTKDSEARAGGLPALGLAGASLTGTLLVVLGFVVVCHLIPWLWHGFVVPVVWPGDVARLAAGQAASFSNLLLRAVVMAGVAIGGLVLLGRFVHREPPGTGAGIFMGVVFVALGIFFVSLGTAIARWLAPNPVVVDTVAVAIAALWGLFVFTRFTKESFQDRLRAFDEQGWFSTAGYKKGQGRLTRRGTILGILAIVACGLYVYARRKFAGHLLDLPWGSYWSIPLGGERELPVLLGPTVAVPLLLGLASVWFALRLVNYPKFADFLIATEGEMNKVSWSTRDRLIQDTLVVLTTLFLMTMLLFALDLIWSTVLSWEWVRVIRTK